MTYTPPLAQPYNRVYCSREPFTREGVMTLDLGAHYRSPEFDDARSAEAWTETLEAWAARLDAAADSDAMGSLMLDIEDECGQCEAWDAIGLCFWRPHVAGLREKARDAILAIPMPETDNA